MQQVRKEVLKKAFFRLQASVRRFAEDRHLDQSESVIDRILFSLKQRVYLPGVRDRAKPLRFCYAPRYLRQQEVV